MNTLAAKKICPFISRAVLFLNIIFTALIIVTAVGMPNQDFWKDFFGAWGIRIVILIFSAWFLYFFCEIFGIIGRLHTKSKAALIFAFMILVFTVQLLIVAVLDLDLIYDSSKIYECALAFLNGQEPLNDYIGMYPHQTGAAIATTCILWGFRLLRLPVGSYITGLSVVMVLFTDFSLMVLSLLAYRLFSAEKAKNIMLFLWILALISPSTIIWGGFYYPTILSLPFFSLTLYFCVMSFQTLSDEKKMPFVYAGLSFVFGWVGYHIRATVAIVMIAYVIALVYVFLSDKKEWKRFCIILCIFALVLAADNFCYNKIFDKVASNRDAESEYPLLDWILIGVSDGGVHNTEDEAYIGEIEGYDAKEAAIKAMITERVSSRDLRETLKWLRDKLYTSWGNGTRDIYGYYCRTNRYGVLHDWIVGDRSGLFSAYSQIVNVVLWILIFMGLLINRKKTCSGAELFLNLIFVGNFLFYLIWEVQGQYNLSVEPLKLFAAAYSAEILYAQLEPQRYEKKKLYVCAGFLFALILPALEIKTFHAATGIADNRSRQAVYQQMWNEKYSLEPDHTLEQTFVSERPFNAFDMILKNPDEERNDVTYQIMLVSDRRGVISEEILQGRDIPSKYFYTGSFAEVYPQRDEIFTIRVTASDGTAQIGLYVYRLKRFIAYDKGELRSIDPDGRTEEVNASLTFRVSDEYVGPYVSKKMYIAVCAVLLLIVILPVVSAVRAVWLRREPS